MFGEDYRLPVQTLWHPFKCVLKMFWKFMLIDMSFKNNGVHFSGCVGYTLPCGSVVWYGSIEVKFWQSYAFLDFVGLIY